MTENEKQEEEKVEKVIKNLSDKKVFAREQYEFLKSKGIVNRMRLSRIFKAAGPGQVQESWQQRSRPESLPVRPGLQRE